MNTLGQYFVALKLSTYLYMYTLTICFSWTLFYKTFCIIQIFTFQYVSPLIALYMHIRGVVGLIKLSEPSFFSLLVLL